MPHPTLPIPPTPRDQQGDWVTLVGPKGGQSFCNLCNTGEYPGFSIPPIPKPILQWRWRGLQDADISLLPYSMSRRRCWDKGRNSLIQFTKCLFPAQLQVRFNFPVLPWGRAFCNLNPCQHPLRERDVSSELATQHPSRERKNPLDNAKVSWEYPAGERGHSPGGLCADTGMQRHPLNTRSAKRSVR